MYGIYVGDMLMASYNTAIEAYQAALYAYEETETFHEVRYVVSNERLDMQVKIS